MTLYPFNYIDLSTIAHGSEKGSGIFSTVYEGISPDTVMKLR